MHEVGKDLRDVGKDLKETGRGMVEKGLDGLADVGERLAPMGSPGAGGIMEDECPVEGVDAPNLQENGKEEEPEASEVVSRLLPPNRATSADSPPLSSFFSSLPDGSHPHRAWYWSGESSIRLVASRASG